LHAGALLVVVLRPEPLPLLASTLLGGPAAVLVQVSAAPFMMRHSGPEERDSLFALNAGINIGVAGLGALVGGVLPGLAVQWLALEPGAAAYRATFAVAAGCTALAALPLLLIAAQPNNGPTIAAAAENQPAVLPPQPAPADREVRHPFRLFAGLRARIEHSSLRELFVALPLALRFMAAPFIISCGAALLIPFLNLYFRQRFAVPDASLGLIFAAISIVTGLATLAAPALSARLGKMRSVVMSQALAIPCLLLLGLAPTLWLAVPVALARGALMNMASPLYDAYAMERSPERARPMVIGLINGAFSAGYIIGPTISAQVQLRYGFGPLFVATAVCYAIAVAVTYLLFLRPRRSVEVAA
ncbi:MAG: MFS transporter, partial [Oscillochloris sp.]|nr:MFS transporter [Oscillochloris sp.]